MTDLQDVLDLFEYKLFRQGKSPHTVRSYLSRVKYFLQWRDERYGATNPLCVTTQQVSEYKIYCLNTKHYAPAGIRHRLSAIHAYIDFLAAQEKPVDKHTNVYHLNAVGEEVPTRNVYTYILSRRDNAISAAIFGGITK